MFNNIIFDFDGTIVDSRPGIVSSFRKVVKELVNKEIREEEIVQLIGTPLIPMLSALLDTNNKAIINRGADLFRKYYSKNGFYQNIVYSGIEEILKSFKDQSCQLFVVSNKIEFFMKKILEQHNLEKYFNFILGTDGTDTQSKKADMVKYLLTCFGLKKRETAIVGDTENDIMAGRKNFIFTIGAAWGYGSKSSLIKAKADKICRTPLELSRLCRDIK